MLTPELQDYIDSFDFSIIGTVEPNELIEQHRDSPFFARRFGGGLQKSRDISKITEVTDDIRENEIVYVSQLLRAYGEHLVKSINSKDEIKENVELYNHFKRQRNCFYYAETLEQFSRDALPPDNHAFESLKDEIFEQVVDICHEDYPNGYIRLKKTIQAAKSANYISNPLNSEIKSQDKTGICHHLVNEKRLNWVKDE